MPSRTIRDTVLDSERYHACPVESRLLFLELLLCADDYALVPIGEVFLRRHTTACEGKTTAQIAGFLTPLMEQDLIRPYTSERGGRFAFIPRFDNRPRALKPKWPVPPDDIDRGYIRSMIPKSEQFRISNIQKKRNTAVPQPGGETETETETETEVISSPSANIPTSIKSRGSRFALTAPAAEWRAWTREHFPAVSIDRTFASFRDYWIAQPGQRGVKTDWFATWRNWLRRDHPEQDRDSDLIASIASDPRFSDMKP